MNINFNNLIPKILPYLIVIVIAYFLNSIIFSYLPKNGIDYENKKSFTLEYKNFDAFYSNVKMPKIEKSKIIEKKQVEIIKLSTYILKAIYSTSSNSGWIIVENKKDKKSTILSQDEIIDGYVLKKLYKNYVIFENNEKEFTLEMNNSKSKVNYNITKVDNYIKEKIIVEEDTVKIKRDYLNSYISDLDKVWNNIAIEELKKDGKTEGFKVLRVSKDSVFSKLGLKKGDTIKAINNTTLNSYADAFKVYNNINKTKYLNLEVLRNNEIVELNYEID